MNIEQVIPAIFNCCINISASSFLKN